MDSISTNERMVVVQAILTRRRIRLASPSICFPLSRRYGLEKLGRSRESQANSGASESRLQDIGETTARYCRSRGKLSKQNMADGRFQGH